jgi:hypothetical protein
VSGAEREGERESGRNVMGDGDESGINREREGREPLPFAAAIAK